MKRISSILLCSAVLAFASASPAEDPSGEPESETVAVVAEGFDVRIPVPDGWFRIDDLEAETPVPQGYRRLAVLAPRDVTQRATIGIPSTVVEVLLYLETAMTPVSAQTFATARKLLMDKFVGREEFDRLMLPPDDPYRPGIPWRECGDRWCCAGCLLPPGSVVYGNPMNVFLSKATGAVLVRGAVVQIDFTKHLSNEEEDAKLRDEAVRYLLEFVALNPVAEDENAVRTSSELVQCSDRDLKGEPLPSCNEDASESHGKTDAMIRTFLAFVYFVMVLLVFLKFRKMILWKYARFDDFKWDGRSDFPKTNPQTATWIEMTGSAIGNIVDFVLSPMRTKQDFFLLSLDDTIIHDPVRCIPVRFLRMGRRNDYLLCKVSPPIPGRCMGILKPGIETVVLASRQSVGGLRRKLVGQHSVHVMRLLSKPGWLGLIQMKDVAPFSWSEIFPTLEEAERAKAIDAETFFLSVYSFEVWDLAKQVPLSWQFFAYGIRKEWMKLSQVPFCFMWFEGRNHSTPFDVEWKACHDEKGFERKEKIWAFLAANEKKEIETKGKEPEASILERWTFVIFDWAHGLDFPAWHRLALADEIAEEFGWPEALSGFTRKEGFPPDDENRRMAAWQIWLDDEREKWRPDRQKGT